MYREAGARGRSLRAEWEERQPQQGPDRATLDACLAGHGMPGWESKLPTFEAGTKLATRRAVNTCLNATLEVVPGILAGAADLTGNTGVALKGAEVQSRESALGTQVHYGIREFGMGVVMNGMAMHGGVLPVGGTFFVFSDYMRPAVRLAALQRAHVMYFWTHDSIGLGEDGPTHQPVEQLASLRAMPGLCLIRPADANECAQAWRIAVDRDGPTGLVLSRQDVPVLAEAAELAAEGVPKGGYVLRRTGGDELPDIVLVGSGSEVQHCLAAADRLAEGGIDVQVVSMPSLDLFEAAGPDHRARVLAVGVPALAVEAAASFGWQRYADETVSIDRFGESAPWAVNMEKFGFTADEVTKRARSLLGAGVLGEGA